MHIPALASTLAAKAPIKLPCLCVPHSLIATVFPNGNPPGVIVGMRMSGGSARMWGTSKGG